MTDSLTRVLIVDDEQFFREAIREIVGEDGFEVLVAEDGEQALEMATDPAIGVVLLDIRLPGIDGIEVLRRMREARPTLRVIMISASTDQELVLDALRLGACDYLAKPLHDEELVLAVRRAVEAYAVQANWTRLRSRLDRLAERMEELGRRVGACPDATERFALLTDGAVEVAGSVLEAGKTSIMLLSDDGLELRVAAAYGRSVSAEEMDPVSIGFGVSGVALDRSEPMVVESVEDDARFPGHAPLGRYESPSFAVAPLVSGDEKVGVLCVTDRTGGGTFAEEDLALLRLLAMQLSELMTAAGRASTGSDVSTPPLSSPSLSSSSPSLESHDPSLQEADTVRGTVADPLQAGEQGLLGSGLDLDGDSPGDAELARLICDAIVSEVEPERVLGGVLTPLAEKLPAAPVSIFLIDGATGNLVREAEHDGGRRSDRKEIAPGRGLTAVVLQSGHLVATRDPAADHRFDPDIDTPEDGEAGPYLCVPLKLRGKTVGILRAFLPAESEVSAGTGEVVSSSASAAIRNVLLYRSLVESIEEVAEARRKARGS